MCWEKPEFFTIFTFAEDLQNVMVKVRVPDCAAALQKYAYHPLLHHTHFYGVLFPWGDDPDLL